MSVVPMKKVRLLVHRNDVEKTLDITQNAGAFEFQEVVLNEGEETAELNELAVPTSSVMPKIVQSLNFLSVYEKPVGILTKLREGTTIDIAESELEERAPKEEALLNILSQVTDLQSELLVVNDKLRQIHEQKEKLEPWSGLSIPLESFSTAHTDTFLLKAKETKGKNTTNQPLSDKLQWALSQEKEVVFQVEKVGENLASVTIFKSENVEELVEKKTKEIEAEIVQLPGQHGTPAEILAELEKKTDSLLEKKAELDKKAEDMSLKYSSTLKIAHDAHTWKQDKQDTLKVAKTTKQVAVFEGWCNELELPTLKEKLIKANLLFDITPISPALSEETPVDIKNSSLVQPFEIVTRLYGLPVHKDLDPTPFLAGFFFLFFGLSLTDVGYGVFLIIVSLLVLFYFKVSSTVKLFGKLLFLMGLSSALVGLLFGGYLGIDASKLPDTLKAIQQFDPIGNPLPVFYLALALGVVQVMFGMLLKIYSEARNGRLTTGLLDQGPWLLLFVSLIAYGASSIGYLATASSDTLLAFIYIAIIMVVVSSGRVGETVLGKIQMSLLSLYNSIGYFSDILSYSRLLALGLATSALAFAVNLIAEIVSDMVPYVGFILSIFILVAGHLFTLVVNTLGAFIHSARLQFVEFFGKFISGTGRNFKPLNRKESYVTVVKDSN